VSDYLSLLERKIEAHTALLGVVGLGYVGLPVACAFAQAGFQVIGVERQAARAALIDHGRSPIEGNEPGLADLLAEVTRRERFHATTDPVCLARADIVIMCVETPVDDDHRPCFEALERACHQLGPVLKEGALVIVESTLAPGTMANRVRPWLERATGRAAGEGFFLGHCPERVMPGRLLANLHGVSRVVGGQTPEVARLMCRLYRRIVEAELDPTDLLTAELVKTAENAYRDVNIAFANEVALICAQVGGDVWKVRDLVNKSPGRQMLMPGAGVGGHCIPKDPWLLVHALDRGRETSLIASARRVNDSMPAEVARLTADCLRQQGVEPQQARIAVLGYAYLQDSDDARNSPTAALLRQLSGLGCEVAVHDPFVREYAGDMFTTLAGADCVVVMVAHAAYRSLALSAIAPLLRHRALVDARHVFSPAALREAGFTFRSLGIGSV
jgi:UDP-N-acetyl-D-mannosaminuronic acid dehydrogenase